MEWISVEDRLPKPEFDDGTVNVWVYTSFGRQGKANYWRGGLWNLPVELQDEVVTHWMPLPEPPE